MTPRASLPTIPTPSAGRFDGIAYALLSTLLAANALRVRLGAVSPADGAAGIADVAAIGVALLVLLVLGRLAVRRERLDGALAFAIGASVGVLFFAGTLGLALADPTAIGWLFTGDWAQHYSGWAMFRHAPWHWPPGRMREIWYPVGTSVVYTDSLPLLALALKPFSAWLPEPFQYIGPWLMLSFTLQGAFAAVLVARAGARSAAVLAGAALFVLAPVLLERIVHDTLTAQWLLLAALALYFRGGPPARLAAEAWPWWLLTAVAALIHPYLAAMTLAIQFAAWWKRTHIDRARTTREAATALGVSLAIAIVAWWLAGAGIIRAADSSGGIAFGRYSMNLLAFVDPLYGSPLLPTFLVPPGQLEGFAYLGAGVLALLLLALVDLARERRVEGIGREWKPLAIVALVLLVCATGGTIALGTWTLADLSFQSRLLGAFRSSGRFVWIAYYVLMLLAIVHVVRRYSPGVAVTLLAAALVVQLFDLAPEHARVARLRQQANATLAGTLDDPRWAELAAGRHHLTLLPPSACGHSAPPYLPLLLFAADHGMTFNSGYLARWNQRKTAGYCESLQRRLASGPWSADDLYVVGDEWKARFERSAPNARCERIDVHDVCVVPPSSLAP